MKRKKTELSDEDDDEILRHATPSKKERRSPVTPPAEPDIRHKSKEEKPPDSSASRLPADTLRISTKGKEREVDVTPSKPKKPSDTEPTPINEKKCKDLLKTLLKLPDASIFSRPVDPVIDGCPT